MRTTFASKILRKTGCIPTYFDFKIFMIPYFIKKFFPILQLLQDTTLNKGRSIPIIKNKTLQIQRVWFITKWMPSLYRRKFFQNVHNSRYIRKPGQHSICLCACLTCIIPVSSFAVVHIGQGSEFRLTCN